MKNVRESQLKTCIFMTEEEFTELGKALFGEGFEADIDYEGIACQVDEDCIEDEVLFKALAEHFGVKTVTSVHVDDCEYIGVWICYKDTE